MSVDKKVVIYLVFEMLIAIISVMGNALVVTIFLRDRRLRTPTNLYVFSLAVTDLLTSTVAMPVYVYSMLTQQPHDFHACLYVNTFILMFCTVSIFHLTAVSFDRYMAVVWRRKPGSHRRGMRHAGILIGAAWLLGALIGCLPVMGWHGGIPDDIAPLKCVFTDVIRMSYLMFLFYATIVTPTVIMIFFYGSIYHTVRKHNDRMQSVHYSLDTRMSKMRKKDAKIGSKSKKQDQKDAADGNQAMVSSRGHMIQQRHGAKTRRVIFSLVLVVVCFFVSWYPLYIMNAVMYYCTECHIEPWWFFAPIVLSHLSSAINPFIYARTMPGYRQAFVEALACKQPTDDDDIDRLNGSSKRRKQIERVSFHKNGQKKEQNGVDI